ncbi:MAG TPA: protein-glutamate O-methyltransferase CheR [Stellaceae bacterium]|nr:protein-glutamate O-methyltransferase CheR [Stellaceae bacterium]
MIHPIDKTLAILRDVMNAHSDTLSTKPSDRRTAAAAAPTDRRLALVRHLMEGVERRTGLDVGATLIEKLLALTARSSLGALESWVMELEGKPPPAPEWQAVIEALTVHETYFLRDPLQLNFLAGRLPNLIAEAEAERRYELRLWSVGCATGEEAYSLAMLALDALVAAGKARERVDGIIPAPPWRIEVLGSDLSITALKRAREGLYETGPLSSCRDLPPAYHRYFEAHQDGKRRGVRADLRRIVQFEPFNLMRDEAPPASFDLVLCRNVLIYLSERARTHALGLLESAVRAGGYLMLGATDSLGEKTSFETIWGRDAVIYRRGFHG